ncbi:MAG: high-affinity branched-chain amino acid ABC transporter permease LivM [Candidatus Omnitrophica bacterium]|nr:high-affinity branched-chain amino acid ABC transporter permease LivM [Candidatus Omnitrophota bacterium]
MKKTAIFLLLFLIPFLDPNSYHIEILATAALYALLALGLNIIVGFAGLLHLGYAAFFAIGAYTYALLNLRLGCPFWLGLPLGMGVAGVGGVLLGLPAVRVRGDYLAIVTLGFGEIVRIVVTNLEPWTGGPNGLLGIAHPVLGGFNFGVDSRPYYWLLLVLVGGIAWVCARLRRSRIGLAWAALREDELAARTLGINGTRLKLLALGLGGGIAGLAGAVFAAKQGTITPDSFDFILSVMILAMVILGGLGSVRGVILGAVVLSVLPELLQGFSTYRMLLFGIGMIGLMRLRPQGLLGISQIRRELQRAAS